MIHQILRAAVAAAVFAATGPAQDQQRPVRPQEPRTERVQKPERPSGQPPAGERQRERTGATPGSQPQGEGKPIASGQVNGQPPSPTEQTRNYMDEHPEVREQLFDKADANGDGKLSPEEREQLKALVAAKMQEVREERQKQGEARQKEIEQRMKERRDRMDVNDDGHVGPRERERAQDIRDHNRDGSNGRELERDRTQQGGSDRPRPTGGAAGPGSGRK